jgi:ribosomal protein S18 acetylase RimI-like enzyme
MFPLTITPIQDEKDLTKLLNFMLKQPQYYPKHEDWIFGKFKTRAENGRYKAILAISDKEVIGAVSYANIDKENTEIKNFRIDSNYQNRDLGHFLLKQVEHQTNKSNIHLDVSVPNFQGVKFFIHNGFKIQKTEYLYCPTQLEYIMTKPSLI